MNVRRAQIVGLGLVGASIGGGLRARGWHVTGADLDEGRAARALELGAIDAVGRDPGAEIAFVATPASAVVGVARELLGAAGPVPGPFVTDVAGVKGPIVAQLSDPRFVAGHPMAGTEQEGHDRADPDLFVGATWVLTPTAATDADAYSFVREIVMGFGAA